MGSRIRENPEQIFDVFLEIARPAGPSQEPFILQQFPAEYNNQDVLKSAAKFAFPCVADSPAVDHFTFVLTDIDGKFRFGFCRHGTHGSQTCLLIISQLPWYEIFYKLLNQCAEILNRSDENSIEPLLTRLYELDTPNPLDPIEVVTPTLTDRFSFVVPDANQLPSIPENRNLTEYYNAVDLNNMMIIFASMLYERRILITSRKLSRLTACVHGAASLIYPMHWQHLYIPVLPAHLLDYCSAPMPYLIGIHSALMERAQQMELGDAVILDADANKVTTEYDDLATLPEEVVSSLKKKLRALQSDRMKNSVLGDGVSRAFLKALVALIGGYRDALKFRPGEQITFEREAFIQSRPASLQPFLEKMLQLQIFEQFINDRLDLLNAGEGFTDEFEVEANMHADKYNTQSKYREWTLQMKKQGRKLRKEGKDKWVELTSRANPAVKHAVKTVRDRSKKAYKDIRSRIDDLQRKEDVMGGLPPTAISAPDIRRARPPRPPPPKNQLGMSSDPPRSHGSYERSNLRQYKVLSLDNGLDSPHDGLGSARRLSSMDGSDISDYKRLSSQDDNYLDFRLDRMSGLLEDPDIQSVFIRSYSLEDVVRLEEEQDGVNYLTLSDDQPDLAVDALVLEQENSQQNQPESDVAGLSLLVESEGSSVAGLSQDSRSSTPCSTGRLTPSISRARPRSPATSSTGSAEGMLALPVARPRPRSPGGSSTSGEAVLAPPVAPPRRRQDQQQNEAQLIHLEASQPNGVHNLGTPDSISKTATIDSLMSGISQMSYGSFTEEELNPSQGDESPRTRASISRQPAFYNAQRPPSVRKRSSQATDAQTIREARSIFMQSEPNPSTYPNSHANDYDMFDPLKSGRVALDVPQACGPDTDKLSGNSDGSQEDNLLKEWNLDFPKVRLSNSQFPKQDGTYPGLNRPSNRHSQYLESSPVMGNTMASRPASVYGHPGFSHPANTPAPLPGTVNLPVRHTSGMDVSNYPVFGVRQALRTPSPVHGMMGGNALGGVFSSQPYSANFKSIGGSPVKHPPPVPHKPSWSPVKSPSSQNDIFSDLDPLKRSPTPHEHSSSKPSQLSNVKPKKSWETFD